MNEGLSITYNVTMDDVITWSKYHYSHSAAYKRTALVWRVAFSVVIVLAILAGWGYDATGFTVAAAWLVVYIVLSYGTWKWSIA